MKPNWQRIVTTVAFATCVLYACTVRLSGVDFWLQAKIGELIVNSHTIPQTLLFPFTEIVTEKFNAHEWLMSVIFHLALATFGEDGMPFLIGALGLALFASMARLTYIRSHGNYAYALIGGFISVLVENYRHVLRPELPSLILMALLLIQLEYFKSRPNISSIFWSGIIIAIWANSHGSFILGPLIVGMYCVGLYVDTVRESHFQILQPSRKVLQFFWLTVFSSAACLINPFGWELVQFVFAFSVTSDASKSLTEWLPTFDSRMFGVRGFWIALGVWSAMVATLIYARKRVSAIDWLMFFAFSYLAYKAIRFPVYIGMVAAYIIPIYLPQSWRQKSAEPRLLYLGIFLSLVTMVGVYQYGNAGRNSIYTDLDTTKLTIPMVNVISDPALHGNVLNSMELGAELIYRAYPRLRPSLDCRLDSYGFEYSNFNGALFNNDALLDEFVLRYDVRYLLMNPRIFDNFQKLSNWKTGKWRLYFGDHRAVFLQRIDIKEGKPVN